jgi:hypothetical protein
MKLIHQIRRLLATISLLLVTVSLTDGQINNSVIPAAIPGDDETKAGRLLSEGKNNTPTGILKLLTYRLEEIKLSEPVRLKDREITTGFRLTITSADKLPVSYFICVEDDCYEAFRLGLYKIGIILLSPTLPNDARLSASSFGSRDGRRVWKDVSVLPERLVVPPPYGFNAAEIENRYILKSVSRFDRMLNQKVQGVEISVEGDYYVGALLWFLQIGDREYFASVKNNILSVWFSDEQFAQLKEGDKIKVKYGNGIFVNGKTVGRLNKGLIRK